MQYVLLMALPLIISVIGGGYITDESSSKRTLGFACVVVATILVVALIAWQMIDPTYYILG